MSLQAGDREPFSEGPQRRDVLRQASGFTELPQPKTTGSSEMELQIVFFIFLLFFFSSSPPRDSSQHRLTDVFSPKLPP